MAQGTVQGTHVEDQRGEEREGREGEGAGAGRKGRDVSWIDRVDVLRHPLSYYPFSSVLVLLLLDAVLTSSSLSVWLLDGVCAACGEYSLWGVRATPGQGAGQRRQGRLTYR